MVTLFLISGIYSFYTISVLTLVIVCDWGWCLLSGIPIPHFRSRAQLPELICSCWLLIVHAPNDPPNRFRPVKQKGCTVEYTTYTSVWLLISSKEFTHADRSPPAELSHSGIVICLLWISTTLFLSLQIHHVHKVYDKICHFY